MLPHAATRCHTLLYAATRCNTLQHYSYISALANTQTGREEILPVGRNEKNQLEKVKRSEPNITKTLSGKIGNREISAI